MKPHQLFKAALILIVPLGGFFLGSQLANEGESSSTSAPEQSKANQKTVRLASDADSVLANLSLGEIRSRISEEAAKAENEQNVADIEILFYEWIQRDPLSALSFAEEKERMDWLMAGIKLAGRSNPQDALQWLGENVKEESRSQFLEAEIYRGFAQADPVTAIATIEALGNGPKRDYLLATALGEWIHQDPSQVFGWLEQQEFSPFVVGTYNQLMDAYITDNPKAAAELLLEMEEQESKTFFVEQAGRSSCKIQSARGTGVGGIARGRKQSSSDGGDHAVMGLFRRSGCGARLCESSPGRRREKSTYRHGGKENFPRRP